ncbi:unnamed protein product [Ceutorhynchus assimilis]|uniref:Uncharacterized protein n=1 Tax=Ceutorhynchus assimilis TaxID=467358 RepID=A0A9N9QEY3_9CUCU|nr:unnamed protein product [Ceutorhynchus assimilis]
MPEKLFSTVTIIMKLLLPIIVFFTYINYSQACNGYSIKILKYKNCVDDSIIKLPDKDFNIVLDKDCNFYTTGCVEITKSFKTAKAKYLAKKPPMPEFEGEVDLCQLSGMLKEKPAITEAMAVLSIPTKCPVEKIKVCGGPEHKYNISKYKNFIGMAAGTSDVKLEIEHDVGKSCVEIQASFTKARRG